MLEDQIKTLQEIYNLNEYYLCYNNFNIFFPHVKNQKYFKIMFNNYTFIFLFTTFLGYSQLFNVFKTLFSPITIISSLKLYSNRAANVSLNCKIGSGGRGCFFLPNCFLKLALTLLFYSFRPSLSSSFRYSSSLSLPFLTLSNYTHLLRPSLPKHPPPHTLFLHRLLIHSLFLYCIFFRSLFSYISPIFVQLSEIVLHLSLSSHFSFPSLYSYIQRSFLSFKQT